MELSKCTGHKYKACWPHKLGCDVQRMCTIRWVDNRALASRRTAVWLRTHSHKNTKPNTHFSPADCPKRARAWEEVKEMGVSGRPRCRLAARIEVNGLPREQSLHWPRRSDGNPITLIRAAPLGPFSRPFQAQPSVNWPCHGSLVEATTRGRCREVNGWQRRAASRAIGCKARPAFPAVAIRMPADKAMFGTKPDVFPDALGG